MKIVTFSTDLLLFGHIICYFLKNPSGNPGLQSFQEATQVKEFINNTSTRDPEANTK